MKPIYFDAKMIRPILDGRKKATRRPVKPQPAGAHMVMDCNEEERTFDFLCGGIKNGVICDWAETVKAPYWPGDVLWVKETWAHPRANPGRFLYRADHPDQSCTWGSWKSSVSMPLAAARIFLRVTDVRAERLQDIDDDGVLAEGLEIGCYFDELWNRAIKPADRPTCSWNSNPWVWVVSFERIGKKEAFGL